LLSLRRKVRNFVKARYPARLGSRQIRGPVSAAAMWLHFGVVWLICSPVALAFQMMPEPDAPVERGRPVISPGNRACGREAFPPAEPEV
jgi:hypothetical protein